MFARLRQNRIRLPKQRPGPARVVRVRHAVVLEFSPAAVRVLLARQPELDALSKRLLEIEVVESAELLAILGPIPPKGEDAIPVEIPPI